MNGRTAVRPRSAAVSRPALARRDDADEDSTGGIKWTEDEPTACVSPAYAGSCGWTIFASSAGPRPSTAELKIVGVCPDLAAEGLHISEGARKLVPSVEKCVVPTPSSSRR